LLIPPNDVDALVEAIRGVTTEQLKYMGENAAERFDRRWTTETAHQLVSEVYRRALRKPKSVALSWQADFGIGSA
jgi:glycosyltransferase involved in cell wall biosynthesis